jgi:hypothetical protein
MRVDNDEGTVPVSRLALTLNTWRRVSDPMDGGRVETKELDRRPRYPKKLKVDIDDGILPVS